MSEAASGDDKPAQADYEMAPYDAYFEMDGFGLDVHRGDDSRERDRDDLDPETVVLGIEMDESALGFPLPRVCAAGGLVQITIGDGPVVVFARTIPEFTATSSRETRSKPRTRESSPTGRRGTPRPVVRPTDAS